jgi:F420-non-reducing hydrogenase iron-sulfur subunit
MSETFEPKILAFLCNWCSYAGADLAGVSRFQYPPNIRVMRTMCSGRVDPMYIIEGLKSGFDAVVVFGCHIGDCHYLDGNVYASKRIQMLEELLDLSGIGRGRTALRWVSAAEGQLFADSVTELTRTVREQGPFDADRFRLQLGALETVLAGPRTRWLTGMDRHLTERRNVYGEKTDEVKYRQVMKQAVLDEYQKALILESLKEGPRSVREMASSTGLPVHTVSLRLNDLERRGLAELKGYEGTTPRFIRLAS